MRILVSFFAVVFALLVVAWALAFFAGPGALVAAIDRVLPLANSQLQSSGVGGVEIADWQVDKVSLAPTLTKLTLDGVKVQFELQPGDRSKVKSEGRARRVTLALDAPLALQGSMTMEGIVATIDPADLPPSLPFDRVSNGTLQLDNLPLSDPKALLQELAQGGPAFLENYVTRGQLSVEADVILRIDGIRLPARLYTERVGDQNRLRFRGQDMVNLTRRMTLDLSPAQVEVISLYPLRLVDLVQITEQARDISRRRFRHDRWKQDALRHVAWSYLLTQRFGPQFATEVTNAYETRPGNEPDERLMDYHNNAVGRLLQAEGVALNNLTEVVRTDGRVILNPSQVTQRAELLR